MLKIEHLDESHEYFGTQEDIEDYYYKNKG